MCFNKRLGRTWIFFLHLFIVKIFKFCKVMLVSSLAHRPLFHIICFDGRGYLASATAVVGVTNFTVTMEKATIVEYASQPNGQSCSFCGALDTSYTQGLWSQSMSCHDYQDLLDRGWRRRGKYFYKSDTKMTCCPMYMIRCKATEFKLSKSQKEAIKRVNKYIITGKLGESDGKKCKEEKAKEEKGVKENIEKMSEINSNSSAEIIHEGASNVTEITTKPNDNSMCDVKTPCSGQDQQTMNTVSKQNGKAMERIILEGRLRKKKRNEQKTLEDYLAELDQVQNCAHKLEIRTYRASTEKQPCLKESYAVYEKYAMAIHKRTKEFCQAAYMEYFINSPLKEDYVEGGPIDGYGLFHQQYLLDGKLIAAGAIDVLPKCVSSVCFCNDPDYQFLWLGTYRSLRELALVRELNRTTPSIVYHVQGFYIHSYPKMSYKKHYSPSWLLCPETYSWIPIQKCLPLLDTNGSSRLEEDGIEEKDRIEDISHVLILHKGTIMPYHHYQTLEESSDSDKDEVQEYAALVGKTCAERMLLLRDCQ